MMRYQLLVGMLACILAFPGLAEPQTDAEIRQLMIQQSIASYPGNCPCPYNRASNGSRVANAARGADRIVYWRNKKNTKLAERYETLHEYFVERKNVWVS